jgi:hypothetical protein
VSGLDLEREGVDSFADGVEAGSFEEEIDPWSGRAAVGRCHDAIGPELSTTRISSSM